MKIAHVTKFYRGFGGVGSYVYQLSKILMEQGHEVIVLHDNDQALVSQKDIPEHFIERLSFVNHPTPKRKATQVLGILEKFQPDMVHIHGSQSLFVESEIRQNFPTVKSLYEHDYCPTGTKFHRAPGKICTHATGKRCRPDMLFKRCTSSWKISEWNSFYQQAHDVIKNDKYYSQLIVHSDYLLKDALQNGISPEQATLIPHYVTEATRFIGLQRVENQILFIGDLTHEKGLGHLIKALATLPRRPRWVLKIIGTGPKLKKFKRLARRFKIRHRLHFSEGTGGQVSESVFQESSMVVIPSLKPETQGFVALKGLSYKKPVIAYDVGAMSEWIENDKTGFLVKPNHVKELAKKIAFVLNHKEDVQNIGKQGCQDVSARFTLEGHLKSLMQVYQEVIQQHKRLSA